MSLRDTERYGSPCFVGTKGGGRGIFNRTNFETTNGRPPRMFSRLREPSNHFEGPAMGVFCSALPMSGRCNFNLIPYPRGPQSLRFPCPMIDSPFWIPPHRPVESEFAPNDDDIEKLPMSRLTLGHAANEDKFESSSPPILCSYLREDERDSLSPPSSCDAISVTSDDGSSGPAETSLPRIIKPRKRRKKDRKLLPMLSPLTVSPLSESTSDYPNVRLRNNNVVNVKSGVSPACFKRDRQYSPVSSKSTSPLIFPTPPPSPAASTATSSSCSEDETTNGRSTGLVPLTEDKALLVRSYSGLRMSTFPPDFNLNLAPHFHDNFNRGRLRHFSTPCPTRRKWFGGAQYSYSEFTSLDNRNFNDHVSVRTSTPTEREWVTLVDPLSEPNNSRSSCIFTVLCYNVLCDKYATSQMYGYCPPWALEWNYRKKGIMEEIRRCSADIITLQEVETDQFFTLFLPELKREGYDGIFSPKSRAKHMSVSERKYVDGCAIFWRTSKFTLVKEHLIEFNQLAMANHDGSQDMLNRVMTKDNIGLAALLHTTQNAWGAVMPDKNNVCQPLLVCTAHIHWDPEFCDVKLIQTIMLMSEVRTIVNQIIEESRSRPGPKLDIEDINVMLCGDLNSLPESGVVEFLTKGSVSMDHEDFKGLGYKTSLQKIALSKNHNSGLVNTSANIYTHSFRLAATYDFNIMPYTNYTYDFKGIIDYIFHSCHSMRTLGVLGPIDPNWFIDNKVLGCPHPHIPSDHFPLLVELELNPSNCSSATHPNGLLHR